MSKERKFALLISAHGLRDAIIIIILILSIIWVNLKIYNTVDRDFTKPIEHKMKPKISLLNRLCRICGKEDKNFIPVFSEEGKKQAIQKKIRTCLYLTVEESDMFPKQICIPCANKLEASWNHSQLCKEGQIIIAMKLESCAPPITNNQELNSANGNEVLNMCEVCSREVYDNDLGIGCDGRCQQWFHCDCINMSELEYNSFANDSSRTWICVKCKTSPHAVEQNLFLKSIERRVKELKENEKVPLTGTTVISLVPLITPPPEDIAPVPVVAASSEVLESQPPTLLANTAPVKLIQSPTAPVEQAPTIPVVDDSVYPESLIQVNPASKPVVYQHVQQRQPPVPAPRRSVPAPKLLPSPRRNISSSVKRRALTEGNTSNLQPSKRSNQICTYCKKSFPDDIIDHHVNLHLRQSFITCIECNKNFRTEEAMSRHRCGASDPISLDSDDEPICL